MELEKDVKIGAVGDVDLAFKDGKIVVVAKAAIAEGDVSISVNISPKAVLELIAAKVGGAIPEEVAKFLESALALA